jgi:hypothetical protein
MARVYLTGIFSKAQFEVNQVNVIILNRHGWCCEVKHCRMRILKYKLMKFLNIDGELILKWLCTPVQTFSLWFLPIRHFPLCKSDLCVKTWGQSRVFECRGASVRVGLLRIQCHGAWQDLTQNGVNLIMLLPPPTSLFSILLVLIKLYLPIPLSCTLSRPSLLPYNYLLSFSPISPNWEFTLSRYFDLAKKKKYL